MSQLKLKLEIDHVRRELESQDNAITADPIFMVQERHRQYGMETDYCEHHCYVRFDDPDIEVNEVNDPTRFDYFNEGNFGDDAPGTWRRVGYVDTWRNIQPFLTRAAAVEFRKTQAHNLGETRIYVESAHRNPEWRWLRALIPQVAKMQRERELPIEWRQQLEALLSRRYQPPELMIFEEVEISSGYHLLARTSNPQESDWSEPYQKSGSASYRSRTVRVPYPPGLLEAQVSEARTRLLKLSDYTDADAAAKSLLDCVAFAELECQCEFEQRLAAEKKISELETRIKQLEEATAAVAELGLAR